eukprot:6212340-Pleurochrysis_carterae.AAC.2
MRDAPVYGIADPSCTAPHLLPAKPEPTQHQHPTSSHRTAAHATEAAAAIAAAALAALERRPRTPPSHAAAASSRACDPGQMCNASGGIA